MPRLLIDARLIVANAKGVGRYAYQLCLQLANRLPADWSLQILLPPCSESLFPSNFRAELIPLPPATEVGSAFFLRSQIKRLDAQLLLKTFESAGYVHGVPTVTICHDIDR